MVYTATFNWQTLSHNVALFHLLARKPNLDKFSIYSNKFFHNFHLSESIFTCPRHLVIWLAWRLFKCSYYSFIVPGLCPLIKWKIANVWFLCFDLSFFWPNVIKLLHNVFYHNTQVKFKFCCCSLYGFRVITLLTVIEKRQVCRFSCDNCRFHWQNIFK